MKRIAITGAAGRMGCDLIKACQQTDGMEITALQERPESSLLVSNAVDLTGIGKLMVVYRQYKPSFRPPEPHPHARPRHRSVVDLTCQIEVNEDLPDHLGILDAGDEPHRPTADRAGLNFDAEDSFQTLRLRLIKARPAAEIMDLGLPVDATD